MKNKTKRLLQLILGFHSYLFVFALFIIATLRFNKKEKDFLFFLKKIAGNGLILDIGANIGVMTYYLAKRHKDSTVISFEPIIGNFKVLKKIIHFFQLKNVKCEQLALGNIEGKVRMLLPLEGKVKMQGLCHVVTGNEQNNEKGFYYEVLVKKLDNYIIEGQYAKPVIAVKIDVENYEFEVLKGAEQLLKRDKPIIYCELWNNENRINTINFLEDLGYKTMILQKDNLCLYNLQMHNSQNFFFIPDK